MNSENFAKIKKAIWAKIKAESTRTQPYRDLLDCCRQCEDSRIAHEESLKLREEISKVLPQAEDMGSLHNVYKESLLFDAPVSFDAYLLYLEINRRPQDRFYQPRRKIMKQLVDAMQALADDELDELFLSMPPRVGKTSILMFYSSWVIGRNSEASNLYSAFSDKITKAFYNGVLEIINDPVTYTWKEIFPDAKLVATNSQDETINIDRRKRYPSLTCRSIESTLNGACDCNGILITDDLVSGIEEAMSKDRLIALWAKCDNDLITRAKEKARILWCGTRWSMIDPAGVRMSLLTEDERFASRRYKIINLPALDEHDESNFNYAYKVGFTTEYYRQRRASFEKNNDMASWTAQYMGEPIERDGSLFSPGEFRYYNGELPDEAPDRIFMAVDPAFGGGDFVAAPICFMYGENIFVHDVVYSDADKRTTQPMLVNAIKKYGIQAVQIEANKSTESYKEEIDNCLREQGIRINIISKPAPNNVAKEQRIFDKAPNIREMMIFRESGKRSRDYDLFLQNVFSFKMFAKNKHDDAPDSLCMAIGMLVLPGKAEVFKRFI